MKQNSKDWKDVVSTYYDKCLAITILFVMFAFIVYPEIETTVIRASEKIMDSIEIPPEIPELIRPPEDIVRPIVNIEIIDDDMDMDDDVIELATIEATRLDPLAPILAVQTTAHGTTSRFVIYEDAPVILRRVSPVYPEHLRRLRSQGTVVLNIEVLVDGTVGAVEVRTSLLAGPGNFDESAVEAVRQWLFQPAKSGGNPVACWVTLPVIFTLQN
jgi:protein TonB